ncbi:efflux RND transporter periplasmic adaptor subunit [Variovorax sp. EL159]|uniref:efflux RND transporter periplasmic adaptor subunit n=1 Tax=Variovorax sp. EL159 TaxID=1566270 RepID=UPI0008860C5A|nr:efflux RND transporter periplasmic adaptor subunit [Variovorax sp. EL159]SCX53874.1 membrane fusion protein, cobalt-zinc-cadmium efflux system [Variovorax sp. EL159]
MRKRTFIATLVAVAASIVLAGCDAGRMFTSSAVAQPVPAARAVVHDGALVAVPENSPLRASIQVAAAESRSVERPIGAPGSIEAAPEKLVKVTSPVAGRIVKLQRALGDSVKAGDALFTLDSADLSNAFGDATKAEAALRQSRRDFERQKLLFEAEITARKDYEAAELAYGAATSDAQVAKNRLAQLGASAGAGSHREYVLRSPISGRVIEMTGAQGGYWNDINAPIMTVADLSTVFLTANVSEKDIAALRVGQKARIDLNAYPDQAFDGTVKYIGEVLDTDTRTVKVRVAIDNRHGRFRPGMFAKVVFSGEAHPAVVVPASALVQSGLYTKVFVEKGAFTYEARNVTVGPVIGDRVEILSGLKAGERIAVKEGVLLND